MPPALSAAVKRASPVSAAYSQEPLKPAALSLLSALVSGQAQYIDAVLSAIVALLCVSSKQSLLL